MPSYSSKHTGVAVDTSVAAVKDTLDAKEEAKLALKTEFNTLKSQIKTVSDNLDIETKAREAAIQAEFNSRVEADNQIRTDISTEAGNLCAYKALYAAYENAEKKIEVETTPIRDTYLNKITADAQTFNGSVHFYKLIEIGESNINDIEPILKVNGLLQTNSIKIKDDSTEGSTFIDVTVKNKATFNGNIIQTSTAEKSTTATLPNIVTQNVSVNGGKILLNADGTAAIANSLTVGDSTTNTKITNNTITTTNVSTTNISASTIVNLTKINTITFDGNKISNIDTLTATGQIEGASFNATSDRRLKNIISEYESKDYLSDLPLYKFTYKSDPNTEYVGLMAQDVKEKFPELVSENEDGYLSIKESKLVYYLMAEVRELREEVKRLKGE